MTLWWSRLSVLSFKTRRFYWLFVHCRTLLLTNSQAPNQNKEPPLTTVPFIRVVLTVVVMVTDPTVGNAAQITTAKLALRARAWS